MKPYRVRIKLLPFGNYAVEARKWPWSWWQEEDRFGTRTRDRDEAIRRARYLMTNIITPHHEIMKGAAQ